jgi:hypothetical protein
MLRATVFTLSLSLLLCLNALENVDQILQRQTQELFDAIPSGSATVWERYLGDRASYTDEAGAVRSKKQMMEQLKPISNGYYGQRQSH